MTAPNMAAITASLERSLQSFSLNHHHHHHHHQTSSSNISTSISISGSSSEYQNSSNYRNNSSDTTLELNSNITLPYHWEQCLDLKTGEVYYINWRTGMKSKEDPRSVDDGFSYFYEEDEDEDEDEEDDEEEDEEEDEGSYGSGGSSVESSSRKQKQNEEDEDDEEEEEDEDNEEESRKGGNVLVVAGCKGCFMYFMVPKQVEDCPKCSGQLLHFDRSDDNA